MTDLVNALVTLRNWCAAVSTVVGAVGLVVSLLVSLLTLF
jgi:hypothetical protein